VTNEVLDFLDTVKKYAGLDAADLEKILHESMSQSSDKLEFYLKIGQIAYCAIAPEQASIFVKTFDRSVSVNDIFEHNVELFSLLRHFSH
jgi:hypothetical protein